MENISEVTDRQYHFLRNRKIKPPPTSGSASTLIRFIKEEHGIPETIKIKMIQRVQGIFLGQQVISKEKQDKNRFGTVHYIYVPPQNVRDKFPDRSISLVEFDGYTIPQFMAHIIWDDETSTTRFVSDLQIFPIGSIFTRQMIEEAVSKWEQEHKKLTAGIDIRLILNDIETDLRKRLFDHLMQVPEHPYVGYAKFLPFCLKQMCVIQMFITLIEPILEKNNVDHTVGASFLDFLTEQICDCFPVTS